MADEQPILWTKFYNELSDKILEYKDKPEELFEKINKVFDDSDIKIPNLIGNTNLNKIDPFTTFGLFNRQNFNSPRGQENRIRLLNSLKSIFDLNSEIPTDFSGIPLIPTFHFRYYYLTNNPEEQIEQLWKLFISANKYVKNQSIENRDEFVESFNSCMNIKGIGLSMITIGLFWMMPDFYIGLDQYNRSILKSDNLPNEFKQFIPENIDYLDGNEYLKLNDYIQKSFKDGTLPFKNAIEFSSNSWIQNKNEILNQNRGEALGDKGIETVHYWTYSPGAHAFKWDEFYDKGIMAIGWGELGDLNEFDSKNSIRETMQKTFDETRSYKNSAHAAWQFVHEMKPGDIIFAKNGVHEVVGRGIVDSEYMFDPSAEDEYKNIRKVNWINKGNWNVKENLALKTLTDITDYSNYVDSLSNLFVEDSEPVESTKITYPEYSKDDFLEEVYLSENNYETLSNLLHHKKNLILVGPPGTGKTFASKRLAYSLIGEKNAEQVEFIQFHQSYSYEDFIMGFRPDINSNGFIIKNGPFYEFCKQAEIDSDNDYFFIIDEINRGNLSKIFGELFTLLEADKRDTNINLLYSDEKFKIPKNVYLIGMMNTADRSLALIDYALRRRFAFYEFNPAFDSDGFIVYQEALNNQKFNRLIQTVKQLNETIKQDDSLGKGFQIGHSYFCSLENETDHLDEILENIVNYEIIPLLEEYWYDEPSKLNEWKARLIGALE